MERHLTPSDVILILETLYLGNDELFPKAKKQFTKALLNIVMYDKPLKHHRIKAKVEHIEWLVKIVPNDDGLCVSQSKVCMN
jgi:hypothetical protein